MKDRNWAEQLIRHLHPNYSLTKFGQVLLIWIPTQQLFELRLGICTHTMLVSTSANGSGNLLGSNQTPLGLHIVKEKHGAGLPSGGILVSRKFTGEIAPVSQKRVHLDKDYITSRILWLAGLEDGKNRGREVDSFQRYIYIHGTAEEGLIGQPASHGCIRLKNQDVIRLFDRTPVGTHVLILDE